MKKIFSFVVVLAAVAMVGCAGNSNKKAAEAQAGETVIEAAACDKCEGECTGKCEECTEKCDKCEKCAECKKEGAEKCEKACAEKKECCKK